MPLVGRGLPTYADSGTSSNAVDTDYTTQWVPSSVPSHITIDISSITGSMYTDPSGFKALLLAWYTNDPDYQPYQGSPGNADIPGTYTIDTNTAAGGGGSEPTSGWVTGTGNLSVSGNVVHSREHIINVAGINWVRISISSMPAGQVAPAQLNIDLWDASRAVNAAHTSYNAGWAFYGDSITARCMGQGWADSNAQVATSLGYQVNARTGWTPVQEACGWSGLTSGGLLSVFPTWLPFFPGKWCSVAIGTNDAGGSVAPATYYSNLYSIVNQIVTAGKIPILPTILYSTASPYQTNIPALNTQISNVLAAFPTAIPGPDLYSIGQSGQINMAGDGVHPAGVGCATYRTIMANFVANLGRGA